MILFCFVIPMEQSSIASSLRSRCNFKTVLDNFAKIGCLNSLQPLNSDLSWSCLQISVLVEDQIDYKIVNDQIIFQKHIK